MRDEKLLMELLEAETEEQALDVLERRGLFKSDAFKKRWRYLGGRSNNQAVVLNQQSSASASLVEKYINGVDAILLRLCKAMGIDPRSPQAPRSMADAVEKFLGDLDEKKQEDIRALADELLVLYAVGRKDRPTLYLYDAGEGQLAKNFPKTFCSLIAHGEEGAYKKDVPFVQGQFNMGGTGVLQFCGEKRRMQLILSRVPKEVAGGDDHEWAFTICAFFENEASWCYLVGDDGEAMTAGTKPLALLPKAGVPKAGEVPKPRTRNVQCGTLIKLYDYQAPKSNVCGELFKKLEEYLLRPPLPMRIVECRESYKANVMAVTVWDCMARWAKNDKLEPEFAEGASFEIDLDNGEKVPGEIRVFRPDANVGRDEDAPHTGVRALINGQSHAKRDARFFRSDKVEKEHIAGSLLVTLMCEGLKKSTKNELFMSNRETFRETKLLTEMLSKLQTLLKGMDELKELNERRYAEKVKNAVKEEDGIKALEQLLASDPTLANLFGSLVPGAVAAKSATNGTGGKIPGKPQPFKGVDFPTFFHRGKEKATTADIEIPRGETVRVSFGTDVKNNYFTRRKPPRGQIKAEGTLNPSHSLCNGRLTFACTVDKKVPSGTLLMSQITISDKRGSGPFVLSINAKVVEPVVDEGEKETRTRKKREPMVQAGPSQPDVSVDNLGVDGPALKIEPVPNQPGRLKIIINKESQLLAAAKGLRPKAEEKAVEFVFKYGLALAAMGMLDSARSAPDWKENEAEYRDRIQQMSNGVARVIVPLCLALPKNLPKEKN